MGDGVRSERIGKRVVDAATAASETYRIWDSELKGFGVKVTAKGVKTYFVWYRVGGGRTAQRKEFTIGRHGVVTAEEARAEATQVLARVRLGQDPQADRQKVRQEMSVADLCDLYLEEGVATKKALTLKNDRYRIARHIKPLIGRRPVSSITKADVEKLMRDIAAGKSAVAPRPTQAQARAAGWKVLRNWKPSMKGNPLFAVKPDGERVQLRGRREALAVGGKGTATRALGLLGAIFNFAIDRGMRPDNPVTRVKRYQDRGLQRFLSGDELGALGTALGRVAEDGANASGLAVIRLLTLTGARRGEIEGLRWSEVDFPRSCLVLADSKTGAKVVPIGAAAMKVLADVPRGSGSEYVFPSANDPTRPYTGTPKVWAKVRAAAGLADVRPHDLRHTFASLAAAGGQSLQLIGTILGHKDTATTKRYAHLADDPVRRAADRTAAAAEAAMAGRSAPIVSIRSA